MRPIEDRLLQRLVDGELPDAQRRALLVQLDSEADGWRRCALAFLQEQTWREALAPLANGVAALAPPSVLPPVPRKRNSQRRAVRVMALAAGLAAAFLMGWILRERPLARTPAVPHAEEAKRAPNAPVPAPPPRPAEVARSEARPSSLDQQVSLLDPLLRRWEQRGYRAEMQKRLLSMELKDGRKIEVPVQEVRLRYVGDRTY